jgi:hypothetical protein
MTTQRKAPAVVSRGPSDQVGTRSAARVTTPDVDRPSIWRPAPRRTIPNHQLHTLADHTRLTRRRQFAMAFQVVADWSSNYPDPTDNYMWGTPYGLTLPELRAEWSRQLSGGWLGWELQERLRPGPLTLAGVAG